MKKALIITYYWPPSGGAGVQRWLKFVKYLRDFGWEPVVFTPENPEFPEIDHSLVMDIPNDLSVVKLPIWEPYDAYKRFMGKKKDEKISSSFLAEKKQNKLLQGISVWIRGNLFIPDARRFWINPASRFLEKYLENNPADLIVSTGPPHSMHVIAMKVAQRTGLPWIADFRDPWTNIDFYQELKLTGRADKKHRRLEIEVLSDATAITVVSRSMVDDFSRIVPREYQVITNGYDEADTSGDKAPALDTRFSIAHIGTLSGSRNPLSLWKVLGEMVSGSPEFARDLEIKLVGKVDYSVIRSIENNGLTPSLNRIEYLPHNEVIKCQQQSQVLLLVINTTPNSKMILTGKLFEYMAARRPVLCIGPVDGDAAKVISETHCGEPAAYDDMAGIKSVVTNFYQKYKQGNLEVSGTGIGQYSRKALTSSMAALMDRLT
jgi:glycosyltransferase involved in cell wall biosynthesis